MGKIAEPGEKEREIIVIPEEPQRTTPSPPREPQKVPEREKEPAKTGSL